MYILFTNCDACHISALQVECFHTNATINPLEYFHKVNINNTLCDKIEWYKSRRKIFHLILIFANKSI